MTIYNLFTKQLLYKISHGVQNVYVLVTTERIITNDVVGAQNKDNSSLS